MRALIQRVRWARVEVEGVINSEIGQGSLVLLGVGRDDGESDARQLAAKTASLRIFEDEVGKMNLCLKDNGGEALAVSQFTLVADTRKGNRPGFGTAAPPEKARGLYDLFVRELMDQGVPVRTGVFGARMAVSLENDGPVTILLESK